MIRTFIRRALRGRPQMLPPGTPAPTFTLPAHDGSEISLEDYAGRRVVLWFYPKADTPGWRNQGNGFRDRIRDFEEHDVAVLGISLDSVEDNRAFAEKHDYPFPLLCDTEREVALAYGAVAEADDQYASRYTFVIGPDGVIEQAIDTKSPGEQAAELLQGMTGM